jgi:hypothetical protein
MTKATTIEAKGLMSIAPKIRELLQLGPMCALELQEQLQLFYPNIPRHRVSSVIWRLHRFQKEIYVAMWKRDTLDGQVMFYPRAYYALGVSPDAIKPEPLPQKELNRRKTIKYRIKVANSVFALGGQVNKKYYTKDMGRKSSVPKGAVLDEFI